MKKFIRNLITLNRRDLIGLACWLLVSIFTGPLALPVMIGRETLLKVFNVLNFILLFA